jgi:hypothetical protein
MGWASLEAFRADLAAGLVPPEVRIAMYDPEAWEHTPYEEQLDPVGAMAEFAALAREYGYRVLMTPHPGLAAVPGAACTKAPEESVIAAFMRCRLPAAAARHADVLDLQLQSLQQDPIAYREAVIAAAGQARDVNPDIEVLAHLTTALAPQATVLYAAWRSAGPWVDGYYMGVPNGRRVDVAVRFLRIVANGADRRG